MKAAFVIAASSSSIDQSTNQISIFGVIEDLSSASFPITPSVVLCALLVREKNEGDTQQIGIRVIFDEGKEPAFSADDLTLDFQGKPRARLVAKLPPFVVPAAGDLRLCIISKNKEIGHWNIKVNALPAATQVEIASGATRPQARSIHADKRRAARKSRKKAASKPRR